MSYSTPESLLDTLNAALGKVSRFEQCALLGYPNYLNIGDSFIWLGEISYLSKICKTKINYISSFDNFSSSVMEQRIGDSPIFITGGGHLGDLWYYHHLFYEKIIAQYRDRPIIIFPQTIYFQNSDNLYKAAKIFNAHPDLTLFVRDQYSYDLSNQYFYNCKIIQAPDMALQLLGVFNSEFNSKPKSINKSQKQSILYHCRCDQEINPVLDPSLTSRISSLPQITVQDWSSYQWLNREKVKPDAAFYWKIPGLVRLVREAWQRRLAIPLEWMSRAQWNLHPQTAQFQQIYDPALHYRSWFLAHAGIYQFQQHRFIITNRLHGHILCLLLKIPHAFLPNSYYKNEAFYHNWSQAIPFCRFVKTAADLDLAVQELLS